MATTNITVKYRPLRIGLLVQEGNIADAIKAARLSTLLWGGMFNPIIPVSGDGKSAQDLLNRFSVDTLVPISHTLEIQKILADNPFVRLPHLHENAIFHEDWRSKKNDLYYLDSLNIIDYYWEKEYRNADKKFKSNCAMVRWGEGDPLANVFVLQFGQYPTQAEYNLLYDFDASFIAGLRARELSITSEKPLPVDIAERITAVSLTAVNLVTYGSHLRPRESGIYIGDEGSFADLVTFWNLRAAGYQPIFIPKGHVERFRPIVEARLKRIDAAFTKAQETTGFVHGIPVHFLPASQDDAQKIIKTFTCKAGFVLNRVDSEREGYGPAAGPPQHHFEPQTVLASIEESYDKPAVSFSLPDKKFLAEISGLGQKDVNWQHLAVSIDMRSEFDYPGYTLKPPFLRALNEFYSREIVFDPWTLRAEEEGIGFITECNTTSIRLTPIVHQTLVERIFQYAGVGAKHSQAGLLASQIIESMHERVPLEACRVFKIRGVRKLLNTLKPDDSVNWNAVLRTIGTEKFDKFKTLYVESREKSELEPSDVLTYLLKKKILAPRLRTWERLLRRKQLFKCKKCGLGSHIRMSAFEGMWCCSYCEHEQYMPPYIGTEFRDKKLWRLKKRGLFSKDNHQEGAMPVITALMVFLRILERGRFVCSTALNLRFDRSCETDLCVLQYDRGEDIEIGIGECKSDGGRITAQDISNLKEVRLKLNAAGLRCFLIFAKAADAFDAEEIELFKQLHAEHVPFVLLTNREMEPYHLYWEKGDEKLPRPHPFKLEELHWDSIAIYLPRDQHGPAAIPAQGAAGQAQ